MFTIESTEGVVDEIKLKDLSLGYDPSVALYLRQVTNEGIILNPFRVLETGLNRSQLGIGFPSQRVRE